MPRAFSLSPGDIEAARSQHDVAAGLQLLSDASSVESEAEMDDGRATTPGVLPRPRINIKADANFGPENEQVSAYESFSSGVSDIGGVDDGNDDAVVSDTPSDEDILSGDDAPHMNKSFVESFFIGEEGVSKKAADARSSALRATKWSLCHPSLGRRPLHIQVSSRRG